MNVVSQNLKLNFKQVPLWYWAVIGLLILPGVVYLADSVIHWGKIHRGVSVNGVNISNLTPTAAESKLTDYVNGISKQPLELEYAGKTRNVERTALDPEINYSGTVNEAMRIGRRGDVVKQFKEKLSSWVGTQEVSLRYRIADKKLEQLLRVIAKQTDITPKDASLVWKDGEVKIIPSALGKRLSKQDARRRIRHALFRSQSAVELPVEIAGAKITEKEAGIAAEQAKEMISQPVTMAYQNNRWILQPGDLGELLTFRSDPQEGKQVLIELDQQKTMGTIEEFTEKYVIEPKDARFVPNGRYVNIIPGKDGQKIDSEAGYSSLLAVIKKKDKRQVDLALTTVAPKIDTEKARGMGVKERVASFTTEFNPGMTSRVNNIHLLAKSLDGILVAPGEVFSFNGTIGPRTAAKGYQEAPIIVSGKLVPGLGGGICQVATTFFNAVFFSGLPVVERRNHSFYISKYPSGRDAMVSWPNMDFKFRNDTPTYILIDTGYNRSSVTVTLYGTEYGRKVTYTTGEFRDFKPYTIEEIPDLTLLEGETKVMDEGIEGRRISVTRTVKLGDQVLFSDTFSSHYRPKIHVVRIGKMKKVPTTAPVAPINSLGVSQLMGLSSAATEASFFRQLKTINR